MQDNIVVGTYSFLRETARCSKCLQWFDKSCENIPEDAFDYEEKQCYCSICPSSVQEVLNKFFEMFNWRLLQICNILARIVLVIEVANKRFQKNL